MVAISALLALCEGKTPITGRFPQKRPVMQSFYVFFVVSFNNIHQARDLKCYDANVDGLMQVRCNSIANALELRLSCTNPSMWCHSNACQIFYVDADVYTHHKPLIFGDFHEMMIMQNRHWPLMHHALHAFVVGGLTQHTTCAVSLCRCTMVNHTYVPCHTTNHNNTYKCFLPVL